MTPIAPAFSFNGINASTGRPLTPPMKLGAVAQLARRPPWDPAHQADLERAHARWSEDELTVAHGVDVGDLRETGWGVVFPHDVDPAIREALEPLLHHRRAQAAEHGRFRELVYRPGESKAKFLARHDVGPGPVDPDRLPYYLMIVGAPEAVPFAFQYQLDVQFAVGRIDLDSPEHFRRYATSVVETEVARGQQACERPRSVTLVGVANDDDEATLRCVRNLVRPLHDALDETWGPSSASYSRSRPWRIEMRTGDEATKAGLREVCGGSETPALLFTASHGLGFDADDPRQARHQGALLCQDWPGPKRWREPVPERFYLSADDVGDDSDVRGLIAFHFACFGAGTPRWDDYARREGERREIASEAFVAGLPKRLLSHPRGAALAVVGHVDRAWTYSFDWPRAPSQIGVFSSTIGQLLEGLPIGSAMEYFNQRYAELSADLNQVLEEVEYGGEPDLMGLTSLWTANNDARAYVLLGDPAVRLPGA